MNTMSLATLHRLSKELNIFASHKDYKSNLLCMGLYRPLPVSGPYLVHGFSLLKKAESEGIKELNIVELPVMDKEKLMTIALECENRGGKYRWSEIEGIISFIEQEKKPDTTIVPLIQGHDDPDFFKKFIAYKSCSPFLKQCINNEVLDFKTAQQVRTLPDRVFQLLLAYKNKNKISFSQVRIFLTTLYEISMRDTYEEPALINLCASFLGQREPVQAAKKIRYPELSAMDEEFTAFTNKTVKSKGISLTAPPFFEGNSFKIEFNFQSKKQLEKKITILQELREKADELFSLL